MQCTYSANTAISIYSNRHSEVSSSCVSCNVSMCSPAIYNFEDVCPFRAAINKGGKHARLNFPLEDYAAELDDLLSALLVSVEIALSLKQESVLMF